MSWGYTKGPTQPSDTDSFGVRISAIDNFSQTFLKFNQMIDKSTRRLAKLQAAMRRTAKISKAVFAAMGVAIGVAVKQFADLEKRVLEITTLMKGKATNAIGTFMNKFISMSNRLPQSSEKLADAFYDIKSALPYVKDTKKLFSVLETSAKAAVGGRTTAQVAAKAIVGVMNAFGDSQRSAKHVADTLFNTVRLGVIRFEDLAKEIGTVATVAKSSNIEFEELSAEMATLTKAGLNAAMSATFLRGAYRTFLKPTKEARTEAKKLGIELNSTTLDMYGLFGAIKKLKDQGATPDQVAKMFPNIRALQAVTAIMNNFEKYNNTLEEIYGTQGMAQAAFEKMMGSLTNQIKVLGNQFQNLGIVVGNMFADDIKKWTKNIGNFLIRFQSLSKTQKEFVSNIVTTTLKLTGLITVISLVAKAISILVNPITVIMAASYLLYKAWTENWYGIREKTEEVWDVVEPIWNKMKEGLGVAYSWTFKKGEGIYNWTKDTLIPWIQDTGIPTLKFGLEFGWNKGKEIWNKLFRTEGQAKKLNDSISKIDGPKIEKGLFWKVLDKGKAAFNVTWKWTMDFAKGISGTMKTAMRTGDWSKVMSGIKDAGQVGLGVTLAVGAVKSFGKLIGKKLPKLASLGFTSSAVGIAAVSLGLEIADDINSEQTGKELSKTIATALSAGATGYFIGGISGAAIGITAALALNIGENIMTGGISKKFQEWRKQIKGYGQSISDSTTKAYKNGFDFIDSFKEGASSGADFSEIFDDFMGNPIVKVASEFAKTFWSAVQLFFATDGLITEILNNLIVNGTSAILNFGSTFAGLIWSGMKNFFKPKNLLDLMSADKKPGQTDPNYWNEITDKNSNNLGLGKEQYAAGGYTGSGNKFAPAGVVHKGEYVVPNWMVEQNPGLIGALENKRTKGYFNGGVVSKSSFGGDGAYDIGLGQFDAGNWDGMSAKEIRKRFEKGLDDVPKMVSTVMKSGLEMALAGSQKSYMSPRGKIEVTELNGLQKSMLSLMEVVLQLSGAYDEVLGEAKEISDQISGGSKEKGYKAMKNNAITQALKGFGDHIKNLVNPMTMFDTMLGDLAIAGKATAEWYKDLADEEYILLGAIQAFKDWNKNDDPDIGQASTKTGMASEWIKGLFSTGINSDNVSQANGLGSGKSQLSAGTSNEVSKGQGAGALSGVTKVVENLMPAFKSLGGFMKGLFGGFGDMLDQISNLNKVLNPITTILSGMFSILEPLINQILSPIVGILKIVGKTIGRMLAPLFKLLGKILSPVIDLFIFAYNALLPVFNGIIWIFTKLSNGIIGIVRGIATAFNWLPGVNINKPDYLDYDEMEMDRIDRDNLEEEGGSNTSGDGGTSYSSGGERHVTQNFSFTYDGAVFTDDEESARQFVDWVIDKLEERGTTVST